MVHATEKTLEEVDDKVDDEVKAPVQAAVDDLKEALEGEDADEISAKIQTLTEVSMKLGEALYKAGEGQEGEDAAADAARDAGDGQEDIVDADFEEVDDEDKKDGTS